MEKKEICDGTFKYGRGYIYLPISLPELPKRVIINDIELIVKDEFHISLVCTKSYEEEVEEKIIDRFCEFVKENSVDFQEFKGEYRFAERAVDGRKTLVGMVNVSGLENFFEVIRKELQIDIDAQPTHVTLYTLEPNEGIGLNSQKDLEEMTSIVSVSEIEEILR